MIAAELMGVAREAAEALLVKLSEDEQAVMVCGMMAARIVAALDQKGGGPTISQMGSLLMSGFNAAMTIELSGRGAPPQRTPMGMLE